MLTSIKNTTNFVSTTFLYDNFILTALLIAVKLNFSNDPRAATLQNLCTFLVRMPALGGERGESLNTFPKTQN